ncbi:hypothetical protein [Nocardia sp. X0981]
MARIANEYAAFAGRLSTYIETYIRTTRAAAGEVIDAGAKVAPRRLAAEDAAAAEGLRNAAGSAHHGTEIRSPRADVGPPAPRPAEGKEPLVPLGRKVVDIVRNAGAGRGNFGIGRARRAEADAAGLVWVGFDAHRRPYADTYRWVSKDGLRQYRPPQQKPSGRGVEANFEARSRTSRHWESNAHLEIAEQ